MSDRVGEKFNRRTGAACRTKMIKITPSTLKFSTTPAMGPAPGQRPLPRRPYPSENSILARYTQKCMPLLSLLPHFLAADARFAHASFKANKARRGREAMGVRVPSDSDLRRLGKISKDLTDHMVGITPREPAFMRVGGKTYAQSFGHLEVSKNGMGLTYKPLKTLSSDAIKKDGARANKNLRDYNANLGFISRDHHLLGVRSARADTPTRIEELLAFGAAVCKPHQLPRDDQGRPIFSPVVITAMDRSRKKAFFGILLRWFGRPGGEERRYLRQQRRAIDKVFGKADSIRRQVGEQTFVIKRPLLYNLPMSSQATSKRAVLRARVHNLPASQALFERLAAACILPGSRATPAMRRLAHSMMQCHTLTEKRSWLALMVMTYGDLQGKLSPSERMAVQALSMGLNNRSLAGGLQTGPLSTGFELLQLAHAFALCGMVPHVGCKSGQDRTATEVGLLVTADVPAGVYPGGKIYEPLADEVDRTAQDHAKKLFSQAVHTFSANPVRLVRGLGPKGRLKLGEGTAYAHPFPAAFLLPKGA